MITALTENEFDTTVLENEKTALVKFWTPSCGHCRVLKTIINDIAEEVAQNADIYSVNLDDYPALGQRFGLTTVPRVLVFKAGEMVQEIGGVQPKEVYIDALAS